MDFITVECYLIVPTSLPTIHDPFITNLQKKCIKYNLPKLINDTPKIVKDKINTHSLQGFINYGTHDMIHKYSNICFIQHCYICQQSQLHL